MSPNENESRGLLTHWNNLCAHYSPRSFSGFHHEGAAASPSNGHTQSQDADLSIE